MIDKLITEIPEGIAINNSLFFFVLCGLLFWGAYIRIDFNQRFVLVTRGFVFERYFNQLLKIDKLNKHTSSFFFNLNYILNISFFVLNLLVFFGFPAQFHFDYYYFILFFTIVIFFKKIIKDFLSNLIFYRLFRDLKLNQSLYYQNAGIVLLFINFTYVLSYSVYHSKIILFGLSSMIILFLFKTFREVVLSVKNKISIFYIILYLCALEIIPLLVIYRFLSND